MYYPTGEDMRCNREIVLSELSKPPVGSDTDCAYYPCHHEGQDCTFCYCPFYPCNDAQVGGREVISKKGIPVWSCKHCHIMHSKEPVEYVHRQLNIKGYGDDDELKSLFEDMKRLFFYPNRDHWESFDERSDD